jgi:hypothetical protein
VQSRFAAKAGTCRVLWASRRGACSLTAVGEEATGRWLEFRGGGPFPLRSSKKISFIWPWLHFLGVSHSSGHGFQPDFWRGAHCSTRNLVLQLLGTHLRIWPWSRYGSQALAARSWLPVGGEIGWPKSVVSSLACFTGAHGPQQWSNSDLGGLQVSACCFSTSRP